MNFGLGFSIMESVFPFFFITVFVLVIGMFVFVIGSGIMRFVKNQRSPEMVAQARALSKRTDIRSSGSHHHHGHMHTGGYVYTRYYITFQLEDGSRLEFQVTSNDYGLIVEGDEGRLFYRGTRFQGFDRT